MNYLELHQQRQENFNNSGPTGPAQEFINAVGTLTTGEQTAIINLVDGLQSNGTWDKYKVIYPFIGGTSGSHKWNLKDPRDLDAAYRLSFTGSFTHSADGVEGDGATGYARTYFNPSSSFSADDEATTILYITDDNVAADADEYIMGSWETAFSSIYNMAIRNVTTASDGEIFIRNSSDFVELDPESNGSENGTVGGNWTMTRSGSTDLELYKDGMLWVTTGSMGTANMPDQDIFLWNMSYLGDTPYSAGYSNHNLAFAAFASPLSATETILDAGIIEEYQQALSREHQPHTSGSELLTDRAGGRFSTGSTDVSMYSVVANASASLNEDSTYIRSGTTSLKISAGTLENNENGSLLYQLGYFNGLIAIGETVKLSGWAYITAVPTADTMEVRIYHQTYPLSAVATLDQTLTDQWQYFSIEKTRVDGTNITLTLKPSTGTVYFDDISAIKV